MFEKILIANRGEIACRIIKTARKMGIKTIAVFSDADRDARHVRLADKAVHIGGAASADSYLKAQTILEVAKKHGAQAIHPGYGFLSENEDFARACEKSGIIFIGPDADSINQMGLKDRAKEIMEEAGVPVVPGYRGEEQGEDFLHQKAQEIGVPLLIKAVAGGGGKGMRLVEDLADFKDLLKSCKREAKASFDNEHVLLERFVQKPRHVEVQVFGDQHGNAVHLYERDCSLQRRHQKVVEEAPAPGLPDAVRKAFGDEAVKAVKALGYKNAGTIEFIMDSKSFDFYFMEMNTRLQVEHPVTEMITGQDLVEWQIRIAAGEPIPLKQDDIKSQGHAFEVRIYAEDAANKFLPQTGEIERFDVLSPARLDSGIETGDKVSIHYDPMIAKLITHGKDRGAALENMREALEKTLLFGVKSNLEFLGNIFKNQEFAQAKLDTGFIAGHFDQLIPEDYGQPALIDFAMIVISLMRQEQACGKQSWQDPWQKKDSWRTNLVSERIYSFSDDVSIRVKARNAHFEVSSGDESCIFEFLSLENGFLRLKKGEEKIDAYVLSAQQERFAVFKNGRVLYAQMSDSALAHEVSGDGRVVTPMPGKIVEVLVRAGDNVDKNQPLLIMEAMKMEMTIRADFAGIVEELPVSVNDQVADGALLVKISEKP